MPDGAIRVEGAAELRRQLRRLDNTVLPRELKAVHRRVADLVVAEARPRVPVRSGKLRDSLRAGVQAKGATIIMGRQSVPYAGWIDFGGERPHHRPYLRRGRIIYPALDATRGEAERLYTLGVAQAIRKADL